MIYAPAELPACHVACICLKGASASTDIGGLRCRAEQSGEAKPSSSSILTMGYPAPSPSCSRPAGTCTHRGECEHHFLVTAFSWAFMELLRGCRRDLSILGKPPGAITAPVLNASSPPVALRWVEDRYGLFRIHCHPPSCASWWPCQQGLAFASQNRTILR